MQPLFDKTQHWTGIPEDLSLNVVEALNEHFEAQKNGLRFFCDGRIYSEELTVSLGFLREGEISQANFQITAPLPAASSEDLTPEEKAEQVHQLLLESLDVSFEILSESLKADRDFLDSLPRQWQKLTDEQPFFFQFSPENSELEAEADRLLGLADKTLVKSQTPTDAVDYGFMINDPDELEAVVDKFRSQLRKSTKH